MNNSVYGKTVENFSPRINISLVNNGTDYKNMQANQGLFHRRHLIKFL